MEQDKNRNVNNNEDRNEDFMKTQYCTTKIANYICTLP